MKEIAFPKDEDCWFVLQYQLVISEIIYIWNLKSYMVFVYVYKLGLFSIYRIYVCIYHLPIYQPVCLSKMKKSSWMGEYGVTYKSCRMKGRGKMLQLYLNSKKKWEKKWNCEGLCETVWTGNTDVEINFRTKQEIEALWNLKYYYILSNKCIINYYILSNTIYICYQILLYTI